MASHVGAPTSVPGSPCGIRSRQISIRVDLSPNISGLPAKFHSSISRPSSVMKLSSVADIMSVPYHSTRKLSRPARSMKRSLPSETWNTENWIYFLSNLVKNCFPSDPYQWEERLLSEPQQETLFLNTDDLHTHFELCPDLLWMHTLCTQSDRFS